MPERSNRRQGKGPSANQSGDRKRTVGSGESTGSIRRSYRCYAQIASRRRAARVRTAHSGYEYASRELRKAQEQRQTTADEVERCDKTLRNLVVDNEQMEARIKALSSDPRMRSVESVQEAAEREQLTKRDLDAAQRDLKRSIEQLESRRETRKTAISDAQAKLKETNATLSRAKKAGGEKRPGTAA